MGQPKKDNSKRDMAVLRTIFATLAVGRIPSLREVASESGYTNPSTYISFLSLHEQGYLLRVQAGGNVLYLPPHVVQGIKEDASFLLEEMEQQ